MQINTDGTWSSAGGGNSGSDTWSFNQADGEITLNVFTPNGTMSTVYILETSSNAGTLVYAAFSDNIDGKGFTRTTLTKQ